VNQVGEANSVRTVSAEQMLCHLLTHCELGEHLHDRALYATSRSLWSDGYVRGRAKQERLAEILSHKLCLDRPRIRAREVREKIIAKADEAHFSLPEALDFAAWAGKVERPRGLRETLAPHPIDASRSRLILIDLYEICFNVGRDVARQDVDGLRRRDLDELRDAFENSTLPLSMLTLETTARTISLTCGALAYLNLSKLSVAKAGAAGLKTKCVLYPVGAAAGALSVFSGCGAVITGASACYWSAGFCLSSIRLSRIVWQRRSEFVHQSRIDARVFDIMAKRSLINHENQVGVVNA
jgi:hypothetical protein